jgi:hypothetical protein
MMDIVVYLFQIKEENGFGLYYKNIFEFKILKVTFKNLFKKTPPET